MTNRKEQECSNTPQPADCEHKHTSTPWEVDGFIIDEAIKRLKGE